MSDRPGQDPPEQDPNEQGSDEQDAARDVTAELLALLDPDSVVAGMLFEQLVAAASHYLEWRGCHDPEGVAAEAVFRALTKALKGEVDPRASGFRKLVFGIAWNVALEGWRREKKAPQLDAENLRHADAGAREHERVEMSLRLDHAARQLPPEEWELIRRYYTGDDHDAQARALGITPGALRVRVHRVKEKLQEKLRRRGDPPSPPSPKRPRPKRPKKG